MRERVARARAKLSSLEIDWDRPLRDGILSALHQEMLAAGTFTLSAIQEALVDAVTDDGGTLTDKRIQGYLKVCWQSYMFATHDDEYDWREKSLSLREEYRDVAAFIERFEESLVYKVWSVLPDDLPGCVEIVRHLLELTGDEEDDDYVARLLRRVRAKRSK